VERKLGRTSPSYEPSQAGSYNTRWRKEARRSRAVARQLALCEANASDPVAGLVKRIRHDANGDAFIQVKQPMDWKMMLPAAMRA
jgi:hypothetical protein